MSNTTPNRFFTEDHRACDALWAEIESAADSDPELVWDKWRAFDAALHRHFAMEEEVLFPAVEDASGMHGMGPTAVMRAEHAQMRAVLQQMGAAADRNDVRGLLDHGDTLLMLIQQHNVKEEGILYPMADRMVAPSWPALAERLAGY